MLALAPWQHPVPPSLQPQANTADCTVTVAMLYAFCNPTVGTSIMHADRVQAEKQQGPAMPS